MRLRDRKFVISFPEDRPFDVVGLGANAVDHLCVVPRFPDFNTKMRIKEYHRLCGGQVATALTVCARNGLKTKYVGKVGSDALGRISLESIRLEGIDVSSVIVEKDAFNQYAFIIIDERNGERTILWDIDPKLSFREGELRREDICLGKHLHIDAHDVHASLQAARWAKESGMLVSIDIDHNAPQVDQLIKYVDFLIVSEGFPAEFVGTSDPERALVRLQERCDGFICMTLGAKGAAALIDGEPTYFPSFKVRAVDTTGAGDVFRGAFIYGLFRGWTVDEIIRFANATAALSCTRIGARSGIVTADEAMRFIASYQPSAVGRS